MACNHFLASKIKELIDMCYTMDFNVIRLINIVITNYLAWPIYCIVYLIFLLNLGKFILNVVYSIELLF